jgi:hypothetical protein
MSFSKMGRRPHRHPGKFAAFAAFAVVLLCAAAAAGWVVMTLWNAVLVDALGAKALGYWQALGLLLLCRILFGNWGPRRMGPPGDPGAMREKWGSMSPEQRERFKEHWKARCGPAGGKSAKQGE